MNIDTTEMRRICHNWPHTTLSHVPALIEEIDTLHARVAELESEVNELRLTDREYWKERAERAEVTNDEIGKHFEARIRELEEKS